jgi:hypothetical protein
MPKPPLDFQTLRLIAEAASGLRYHDIWFVVHYDSSGQVVVTPYDSPQSETHETRVVPSTRVPYGPPPEVTVAKIGTKDITIDLLALNVGRKKPAEPREFYTPDAVFWSVSAVEKFMSPYYASAYGDNGGQIVEALLKVLQPELPREGGAGANAIQAFAIAHLPNSEYTAVPNTVPEAIALHTDGEVRLVPLHSHGSYGADDAQNSGSRAT